MSSVPTNLGSNVKRPSLLRGAADSSSTAMPMPSGGRGRPPRQQRGAVAAAAADEEPRRSAADDESGVFAMDMETDDPAASDPAVKRFASASDAKVDESERHIVDQPRRERSSAGGGSGTSSRRPSADQSEPKRPRRTGGNVSASAPVTPTLGPLGVSPPSVSALVPLEADLHPQTMLRTNEFTSGRRVFHVNFGHGFVGALSAEPTPGATQPPEIHRVLTPKTHNIHVHFDNPKYKNVTLRAFYAVPKMVIIPSSSALRKQKLQLAIGSTPADDAARASLVRQLLTLGSTREACSLVLRWKLQRTFEPSALVQRLVQTKHHAAAVRFAREFGLGGDADELSPRGLLARMLREKRFEGALKAVGASSATVDGTSSPSDVIELMVREGNHAVALKYVHKFGLRATFPPAGLVEACLKAEGELTVRTCGLLLKYVKLLELEETFPLPVLLERCAESGVTVHEMDGGRYVLKGRNRKVAQPGSTSAQGLGTPSGTPPN